MRRSPLVLSLSNRSTEAARFNCPYCEKLFIHPNHYKSVPPSSHHPQLCHGEPELTLFTRRKHLDSHKGKAKSCFVCNGRYSRYDVLLRHVVGQHGYDMGAAKELIDLMEQSEAYY